MTMKQDDSTGTSNHRTVYRSAADSAFTQDRLLSREVKKFRSLNAKSQKIWEEARCYLPGGSSRANSYLPPFPPYLAKGEGSVITDVDGNNRFDFFGNASALILGHAHPSVVRAVEKQLIHGTVYILPTTLEVNLAKALCERIPSLERVRFTNSGTEANIHLYRTARAFTGKRKIAKMEGGYHGSDDTSQISDRPPVAEAGDPFEPIAHPCTRGIPAGITDDVVVFPFNNLDAVERIVAKHKDDLAGLIVEPFASRGYIPPADGFLQGLREITKQHGILLMFDEVHSFRLAPGGAQELYGVNPDLTSLGKIIGGGFPVGAFGGRADIMDLYDLSQNIAGANLVHHGTFNANPVTVVAGLATLEELKPETYRQLAARSDEFRQRIQDLFLTKGISGHTTGDGSLFKIQFTHLPVTDYRSTHNSDKMMEQRMFYFMLNRGVYVCRTGRVALSLPISEKEVNHFLSVLEEYLQAVSQDYL